MIIRGFYKILAKTELNSTDLFDYLDLAMKYDRVYRDCDDIFALSQEDSGVDKKGDTYTISLPDAGEGLPVFIRPCAGPETYAVFYENFFISYFIDGDDYIVRVHMKRPEDTWKFRKNTNGNGFDILNPLNVNAEVYVRYNVDVLHLSRCEGEEYRAGSWNKMFYKTLTSFKDKVRGFTEINRIKESYAK